jgi:hypothetical protein
MAGQVPKMRGVLGDFLRVPGGRDYIVQVPGVATSKLSDAEIARLMNWLLREMGPPLPPGSRPYPAGGARLARALAAQARTLRAALMSRSPNCPRARWSRPARPAWADNGPPCW